MAAKAIHSMIRALDEARSVSFYRTALGLEIVNRYDFPNFVLIYLASASTTFELELTINKGRSSLTRWATATGISPCQSTTSTASTLA